MREGDYVVTRRRFHSPHTIRRGTRGTVVSLDGDWATIEAPSGGFFQAHTDNLNVLVKRKDTLE